MKRMRSKRFWGVALVAVLAFSAVTAANASAAVFKASGTGTLSGKALNNQVFNTGFGQVTCTGAAVSGAVTKPETETLEVTVKYSRCTAFGFAVSVSEAKYSFNTNGSVTFLNTVTAAVPAAGCSLTVAPQGPLKTVTYVNKAGKIEWSSRSAASDRKGPAAFAVAKAPTGRSPAAC